MENKATEEGFASGLLRLPVPTTADVRRLDSVLEKEAPVVGILVIEPDFPVGLVRCPSFSQELEACPSPRRSRKPVALLSVHPRGKTTSKRPDQESLKAPLPAPVPRGLVASY